MSAFLKWMDDRLNPVLVKEVRQALRGKQFRSAFTFTLVVSVIVAVSIVIGTADRAEWTPVGPPFFIGIFACLTLAVIGFVPMAAFQSMGSEWDENTFDMLALSHLRPRHIVLGKLLAAGVQALLYFSIFGFFSVFTFLLGGVDLVLVAVAIPLLAMVSLAYSSLAVALSSLSQKRMVRVLLMVLLSGALVGTIFGAVGIVVESVESSIDFSLPEVQTVLSALIVSAFVLGGLCFVLACSRLAHPEENRSSGLRAFGFVLVLVGMYWVNWMFTQIGQAEVVGYLSCFVVLAVTLMGAFFATEREGLGLRVAAHLPQNPVLRVLALPWLPGGGRGFLWLLGMLGLVLAWVWWTLQSVSSIGMGVLGGVIVATEERHEMFGLVLAACAYSVVYVGLVSALWSNRRSDLKRSVQSRIYIPVLFLAGVLLPAILGLMLGDRDLAQTEHVGNPFWVFSRMERLGAASYLESELAPVLYLAVLALALQLLRLLRGVREVLAGPVMPPEIESYEAPQAVSSRPPSDAGGSA